VKQEKVELTKYGNKKVVKNQEKLLWDKIEKDVKRTRVDLAFYMAINHDKNTREN